jgi:N-methylhydantoinase B
MSDRIDLVTRELLWSSFLAIAEEMALVEYRTSFSPVIREMLDFACSLLDDQGRLLADSNHTPSQTGTLELALQGILRKHGQLEEGDIVLTNDPYSGATHLPDVEVFMPVYHEGELLGYTATVAHHVDVGGVSARTRGTIPGARDLVRDIFEEGLQLPGVKLFSRGVRNDAVWDVLLANVRDPDMSIGDFSAQVSASARGALRLRELATKFGADTVRVAMEGLIDDTEKRARAAIGSWPQRTVTAEAHLDGDGLNYDRPIRLKMSLTVADGTLHVDFAGTDAETPGTNNVPLASAYAAVYYGVKCFLNSDVRQNHGYWRCVQVTAPHGSLVNPRRPRAVVSRHVTVQRIADLMFQMLGELVPDRAVASSHVSFPVLHVRTYDERYGEVRSMMDMVGGGGGARANAPGDNTVDSYTSNCALLPAEIIEIDYPWRVLRSELVEGSGGEGTHHGGLGMRREYELVGDSAIGRVQSEQRAPERGAAGVAGGGRGAPAQMLLRRAGSEEWRVLRHEESALTMRRGDVVAIVSAGGGGYGPPDVTPPA